MFCKKDKKKGLIIGFLTGLISAVGTYYVVSKAKDEIRTVVKCELMDRDSFLEDYDEE